MNNMMGSFNSSKNFSGNFKKIYYDNNQVSNLSLDIWSPIIVKISQEEKYSSKIYTTYQVKKSDFTIEIISDKLYGKASLWWTILLANDEDDPFDFLNNVMDEDSKYSNSIIKVFTNDGIVKILDNLPKQFDLNDAIRNRNK
jgi:hypothetical protein